MVARKLISIISPAYNEEENISTLVREARRAMEKLKQRYDYEYILVDDGSQDRTWEVMVQESRQSEKVKALRLTRNFGQQLALTAGIDKARGDLLIYCDSDLQHPPALFIEMVKEWEKGAKVVHTLRLETEGNAVLKKMMSRLFYLLANFLSETPLQSDMADFKLLDREVYMQLRAMRERNRFLRGLIPWLGFPAATVKYKARRRVHGTPWYNFRRNLSFAKSGLLSVSTKPLKYIGYLGFFMVILSLLGLILALALMIIKADPRYISPIFMLMMVNTFLIGLVLLCLGLVALYISYLHQEVIRRPLYVITESVNVKD